MKRISRRIILLACGVIAAAALVTGTRGTEADMAPARIRIIYTNDTLGYLEPCGCGGRYEGGLARRASAIARLTKGNPDSLIVDSGNLSDTPEKLGIICSIMAGMNYEAIGIGKNDSAHFSEFIKQASLSGLKLIDASQLKDRPALPYFIKKICGVRVGVVSFGANLSTSPSGQQTFTSAYKAARSLSDLLILLDQGGIATRQWLNGTGKRLGAPDLVIGGAAKGIAATEQTIGKTHILPTSDLGRHIGVADLKIASDGSVSVAPQLILINDTTAEDPAVAKRIETFLLGSTGPAAQTSEWGKGKYIAPETCKGCHKQIYDDWRKTKHAAATATLVSKNRMIPACLPCHSEEYRQTLKTTRDEKTKPAGVECATCHAGVLPHGPDGPTPASSRKVDPKTCTACHTPQRSPNYSEAAYMMRASHSYAK